MTKKQLSHIVFVPYPDAPDRWACVLSISRYPSDPWTSWEQDLTLLLDPPPELHILSSSQENLISVRCCCTHSQEGSHLLSHCLSQVDIQYTCVLTDIFVWFCMFLFFSLMVMFMWNTITVRQTCGLLFSWLPSILLCKCATAYPVLLLWVFTSSVF